MYSEWPKRLYIYGTRPNTNPPVFKLSNRVFNMLAISMQSLSRSFQAIESGTHLGGPDSRAGDGVLAEVLVQVEQDAGVLSSVEGGEVTAAGGGRAGASDLEVDALGVGLGAVGLSGGVEGEDLVAENVVTRGETLGDGDRPSEAVGDEVVGGPVAGVGAGVQACLGDLGELKRSLVDGGEVTGDGGDVVDNRAVVALGPGVPLAHHQ